MKLKYMLLVLMSLCWTSCSKEENADLVKLQREVRVTAGADTQSRVVLNDEGNRISSLWQDGDQISLFTSTQSNLVYRTMVEENSANATFTPVDEVLEDREGNPVYACYPDVTLASEEGIVVSLPSTEVMDYDGGRIRSFGYAVDTISQGSVHFKFKHLSAFLGLTITPDMLSDATKGICSVTVKTSSTEPLSIGEGDTFEFSTLTASTTHGSNTVVVNVDNLVVDSLWTIYIPVLPQPAGANISVDLADNNGAALYTVTKPTPENGFLAGHVYKQRTDAINDTIQEFINEFAVRVDAEAVEEVLEVTGVGSLSVEDCRIVNDSDEAVEMGLSIPYKAGYEYRGEESRSVVSSLSALKAETKIYQSRIVVLARTVAVVSATQRKVPLILTIDDMDYYLWEYENIQVQVNVESLNDEDNDGNNGGHGNGNAGGGIEGAE